MMKKKCNPHAFVWLGFIFSFPCAFLNPASASQDLLYVNIYGYNAAGYELTFLRHLQEISIQQKLLFHNDPDTLSQARMIITPRVETQGRFEFAVNEITFQDYRTHGPVLHVLRKNRCLTQVCSVKNFEKVFQESFRELKTKLKSDSNVSSISF